MGFSPLGLLVSALVLAPNLLLLRFPPRPALPAVSAPWPLMIAERVGQALCLVVPAITEPGVIGWGGAAPVALAVAGYLALWGRYLSLRSPAALFGPVLRIPVPMAILPVVAFAATAAWLANPWIAAAALVLAIGHIPSSLLTARAVAGMRSHDSRG